MKPGWRPLLIGAAVIAAAMVLSVREGRRPAQAGGACCPLLAGLDGLALSSSTGAPVPDGKTNLSPADWFFPEWAAQAKFNQPERVRDTDSAVGRLSTRTKEIGLKDLARMHGHLCDGLVISFVQLKAALHRLFPDGVVDRTDLRVVSKNGPCWVDTAGWLTGARINFQTLRVDASIGDGFIVQRISTGDAWEVRLRPGVFPEPQAALENHIRELRAAGQSVNPGEVDRFEAMANELIRHLLNTSPDDLLVLTPRPGYRFQFNDLYGGRGDIINRDLHQQPASTNHN
jgi:formylmethanofuran dehydrogenase subunit E